MTRPPSFTMPDIEIASPEECAALEQLVVELRQAADKVTAVTGVKQYTLYAPGRARTR